MTMTRRLVSPFCALMLAGWATIRASDLFVPAKVLVSETRPGQLGVTTKKKARQ